MAHRRGRAGIGRIQKSKFNEKAEEIKAVSLGSACTFVYFDMCVVKRSKLMDAIL
jgi:hypothetical protein